MGQEYVTLTEEVSMPPLLLALLACDSSTPVGQKRFEDLPLEQRFGPCGEGDRHGHTSDLDTDQINALVAYLRTL